MNEIFVQLKQQFASIGPSLLAGLAVLVLGWLVALLASLVVRKLLARTAVDDRVGWFIARVVQRLVQSLLASAGLDRLSEKWGLAASLGRQKLSGVIGLVVHYVILVPVLISGLGALQLDAVTKPASDMLGKRMSAMPNLIGALLVLILALAGAMALRQTGLANEIVNLAFGLTLGAAAVAAALAFGLGGRDMAARTLLEWREGGQDKKP